MERQIAYESTEGNEIRHRFEAVRDVNDLIRQHDDKRGLVDLLCGIFLDQTAYYGAIVFLTDNQENKPEIQTIGFNTREGLIENQIRESYPTHCVDHARQADQIHIQHVDDHACNGCPVRGVFPDFKFSLNGKISFDGSQHGFLVAFLKPDRAPESETGRFEAALKDLGYALNLWEHESKLKLQLRAADETNRNHLQFFSMLGHELKNPLNGIIGMAELLQMRNFDLETNKNIKIIRNSGQILLELINDIVEFNRMEIGEFSVIPEATRIAEELADFEEMMSVRASLKQIEFCLSNQLGAEVYEIDWPRIQQVLLNLTTNSIKFTPSGGRIEIRLFDIKPDRIGCTVIDNGIGMDLAKQPNIFAPFAQAHGSKSHRAGGTGLGLTICKFIVDKCHGRIEVESQPGMGASFRFDIKAPPVTN